MKTVHAVFENGVFRPKEQVDLPENAEVEFEPRLVRNGQAPASLEDVYAILSARFASGQSDVAARHNEHQP